jgi:hypothetical protein
VSGSSEIYPLIDSITVVNDVIAMKIAAYMYLQELLLLIADAGSLSAISARWKIASVE